MFLFAPIRWVFRLITLLVFAAGIYLVVSGVQVFEAAQLSSSAVHYKPVNALVVVSASSEPKALDHNALARLSQVRALYADHRAPRVVIASTGKQSSLGTIAANWLARNGVVRSALVSVRCGSLSGCFGPVATALGPKSSILVVTEAVRASWVEHAADGAGLHALVVPAKGSVPAAFSQISPTFRQAGALALGRIIGFGRIPWAGP